MELTVVQQVCIWAIPLIFAITLHEVAHGWVANFFGDKTAKLSGRLSLNPVKHIDLVGTIIIPAVLLLSGSKFLFGYAKPVPVNAKNLPHPRYQMPLVSLAGPLANIIMGLLWALIAKLVFLFGSDNAWFAIPLLEMAGKGVLINVILAVLNCFPIPPLDGWHVLSFALPPRLSWYMSRLENLGPLFWFMLIMALIYLGILGALMTPIVGAIINWMLTVFSIQGLGGYII